MIPPTSIRCPTCQRVMVLMATRDRYKCLSCHSLKVVEQKLSPIQQLRMLNAEEPKGGS